MDFTDKNQAIEREVLMWFMTGTIFTRLVMKVASSAFIESFQSAPYV